MAAGLVNASSRFENQRRSRERGADRTPALREKDMVIATALGAKILENLFL